MRISTITLFIYEAGVIHMESQLGAIIGLAHKI